MQIVYDRKAWAKIQHWVQKAPGECSGFGSCQLTVKNGLYTLRVVDAVMAMQRNTGVTTEIDESDAGDAEYRIEQVEKTGIMRLWWHSHANMGVFWSGQDIRQMKQHGEHGWFAASVFNKKGEVLSALSVGKPFAMILNNVPTRVEEHVDAALAAECDAEYAKFCTAPAAARGLQVGGGIGYTGSGGYYWSEDEIGVYRSHSSAAQRGTDRAARRALREAEKDEEKYAEWQQARSRTFEVEDDTPVTAPSQPALATKFSPEELSTLKEAADVFSEEDIQALFNSGQLTQAEADEIRKFGRS
jgi:proteasome lid subunit RPN8/RPN11